MRRDEGGYGEAVDAFDLEAWLHAETETKPGGGSECCVRTCPQCGNDEHKLYVNVSKKRWICYVCDWGRGLKDIAVLMSSVSGGTVHDARLEIVRALKPLAPVGTTDEFSLRLAGALGGAGADAEPAEQPALVLPGQDEFTGGTGVAALVYARNRGLFDDEIIRYRLRPAWELPTKTRSFTGPFIVFPNYYRGKAVSWQGRQTGKKEPRYVSSDDVAQWLWPLDDWALPSYRGRAVVLVEGVFDACGLWRMGIPAVATYGKKVSDSQVRLLRELGASAVILAWDADSARTSGRRLARGAKNLRGEIEAAALRLGKSFDTWVVDFSVGAGASKVDPGDVLNNREAEEWVRERLDDRMEVGTERFYLWRLS